MSWNEIYICQNGRWFFPISMINGETPGNGILKVKCGWNKEDYINDVKHIECYVGLLNSGRKFEEKDAMERFRGNCELVNHHSDIADI